MLGSHQGERTQDWCSWSVVLENTAWNQMAPICSQRGNEEDNQATEPHSDNPVTASFHIWAHCTHGWWRRCQDDLNGSPTRELEETTRASPYHLAEHCPARSESLQPHGEWSSRPGSELPSVEADIYVWHSSHYALPVVHARKEALPPDLTLSLTLTLTIIPAPLTILNPTNPNRNTKMAIYAPKLDNYCLGSGYLMGIQVINYPGNLLLPATTQACI